MPPSPSSSPSLADDYYYSQQYTQDFSDSDRSPTTASAHSDDPPAAPLKKPASLAHIAVPSFAAFRSQLPNRPQATTHPSPRAASFSISEKASPRLIPPAARPLSLNPVPPPRDPIPIYHPQSAVEQQSEQNQRPDSRISAPAHARTESIDSRLASTVGSFVLDDSSRHSGHSIYEDYANDSTHSHAHTHSRSSTSHHSEQGSLAQPGSQAPIIAVRRAPTMTVEHFDSPKRTLSEESLGAASNTFQAERPKTPIGRLGTFFGWKSPQPKSEDETSPTTTFSEKSLSPFSSPHSKPSRMGSTSEARPTPAGLDIQKANLEPSVYLDLPGTPFSLGDHATTAHHVKDLERELAHISQELAASIRREMELEDELDRMRAEFPSAPQSENGRRSSDYFSDSGTSLARFPITDMDAQLEKLEKQVRKAEQQKANLKVETASRLQVELGRRRDLEEHVQNLEGQLSRQSRQGSTVSDERLTDLEAALDESKRRLAQEKEAKENLGDLYSATREELERQRNEREREVAEYQKLLYENTRMQQELATYRGDGHARFATDSIAEEGSARALPRMGLSRSGSLARSSSLRRGGSLTKDGNRTRSGSAGMGFPEGVKEIEDQRDALHKALQLLIKRYERQQRDHERAVRKLTAARQRAEALTPQRSTYSREVAFLKEEVSVLRKRTEDALEQKWQYEKGLSGIKMDLDAAEQETRGLRILLQGHDITPLSPGRESDSGPSVDGKLSSSISTAEKERDQARKVAAEYRQRAGTAPDGGKQLLTSAQRMDDLADQLEAQVQSNVQLRGRLAQAVAQGEQAQKESTRQIEEMQKRLAGMEDSVLAAQQHSETTLADHDAEVRLIEDAVASPRLQRLTIDMAADNAAAGKLLAPPSPLLRKSPKLLSKKLSESSLLEVSQTQMLQRKVKELEGLLREAEEDVQTVVQRVNRSQVEVADLQTERDAALSQMRKLQALVVEERERAERAM